MLGLAIANLNIFYKKSLHLHFFITTLHQGLHVGLFMGVDLF